MLGAVKILLTVFVAYAVGGCRTVDSLSLWNDDVQSKRAIVEYVATVTDESSPDFIPPERRIAVFDLDGTLFCETDPTYFDWMLFDNRVLSLRASPRRKRRRPPREICARAGWFRRWT